MMDVINPSARIVRTINQRLSLRPPQAVSLEILDDVLGRIEITKLSDPNIALAAIRAAYPRVEDFERDFPSLCFALATGVGKTRLMGAFISYLYLVGKSRHFFVLAPNKTIYDKLIGDFSPETPKYVFRVLPNSRKTRRSSSQATITRPVAAYALTRDVRPICSARTFMSIFSTSTRSIRKKARAGSRR